MNGYQADFDAANGWTGSFYEEGGRGILAKRGQKIEIDRKRREEGSRHDDAGEGNRRVDQEGRRLERLRRHRKGNQITFKVNGLTTVELTDNEASKAAASGILALQLHAGPPMTVQFKDIMLKELK